MARVLSSSAGEMNERSTSCCLRSRSRRASARFTSARETAARAAVTLAVAVSTWARDASTSACDWRTRCSKFSGSMRAISCPCLTSALKSTSTSLSWPDTCEPTCTEVTGFSVPVADTLALIGPRTTAAVRYSIASRSSGPWRQYQ